MPTMGRLVGAVLFGALAWYVTLLIVPLFEEDTSLGWFQEVNTVIGLFAGWTIAGPRAGTGYIASFSYGLTTLVAMVIMGLFFNSFAVMIERSLRKRYGGPGEAVTDVFALFIDHGRLMATSEIITTLLFGALAAGLVVEFFGKRYS